LGLQQFALIFLDSKEKQQIVDEPPITIPTCVHLRDWSEQTINQSSDSLLSTAAIPKHSSNSLEMKTSPSQDENLSFSKHDISRQESSRKDATSLDRLSNIFIKIFLHFSIC
jgi:hypothetical protein